MGNLHVFREFRGGNLFLAFWALSPVTFMHLLFMFIEAVCTEELLANIALFLWPMNPFDVMR